jgi:hypothetical protein
MFIMISLHLHLNNSKFHNVQIIRQYEVNIHLLNDKHDK